MIKSFFVRPYASFVSKRILRDQKHAIRDQKNILRNLLKRARNTVFGKDHQFDKINSYQDFQEQVPISDYEGLRSYIEMIKAGKSDVLWPGKPKYFAKTSGTTSGVKYIPISKESIPNHINTARNALLNFIHLKKRYDLFDGAVIFLSGSPKLDQIAHIPTGRLSGIVNHEIPLWVRSSQMPSTETNLIEDWEEKLKHIVEETLLADMRLISGIPPWVQMYYEKLLEVSGKKTIKEIFPNLDFFVFGGVNYAPYKASLEKLVGAQITSLETYPASEGFIAFQNDPEDSDLLLNTNSGIFFEFVPLEEIHKDAPKRLELSEVKTGIDYAIIINNNAGLWGYNIGDTVKFTSLNPYKLVVSGRIKHFISAFGEHVIAKEVETALSYALDKQEANVLEFTVAPQVTPDNSLPYHEWFIEFGESPESMERFQADLNQSMIDQNIYYKDLIEGNILSGLKITPLKKNAFQSYMASKGKLGGQNKVPRLSNDRNIANQLTKFRLKSQ